MVKLGYARDDLMSMLKRDDLSRKEKTAIRFALHHIDECIKLRQSLHEARELIEEMASSGVESYNVGYMVMQVPMATLDAARKWLEENGNA